MLSIESKMTSSTKHALRFAAFALLLLASGQITQAAPLSLDSSGATAESSADVELHQEGIRLYRQGDQKRAEDLFRQVVKRSPKYLPARYDLAALLIGQGRFPEGVAHYELIATKLAPNDAEARRRYAVVLNRAQRTSQAISQFEKSLQISPERKDTRRDLVKLLLTAQDYMKAVSVSDTGVRLHPDDASVQNDHGVVLMRLGKPGEAVKSFEKAVELDAEHPDAHYNMGLALNEQWQLADAEEHLRKALDIRPDYTDAYYNLGKVLARSNKTWPSRTAWRSLKR